MIILVDKKLKRNILITLAVIITIFTVTIFGITAENTAPEDSAKLPFSIPEDSVKLPIIMYHSILNDDDKAGKYVVTPKSLKADLDYIKENGFTTVVTKDLIDYVEMGTPLPEKPILLSFDDGYYNNYSYLFPLLKENNMKAVISIVGIYTDRDSESVKKPNNNYSYLSWAQIEEMQASGLVEIQNHTYNMHSPKKRRGILRKRGESQETYKSLLVEDISKLNDEVMHYTGVLPTTFTYPFGNVNKESRAVVESIGFKVTFSCAEGINVICKDISCLKDLKRYVRSGRTNTTSFFNKLENLL